MRSLRSLPLALAAALLCPGCTGVRYRSDQVDLLFVVDNSTSMAANQAVLAESFPALTEALRAPGGELPDLRVGVVSTDLGAGGAPTCVGGGDGGKLRNIPRVEGCTPPTDAWLSYRDGVTNIASGAADPELRLAEGFACIAPLGEKGCGFEQPLQAARVALDPSVNPGFLRASSLLAIVFVSDEDDCSAANPALYDKEQAGIGPLDSFRCIAQGLVCNEPLREVGVKHNCAPGQDWLHPVEAYTRFFGGLREKGRLFLVAVAAPMAAIEVVAQGTSFTIQTSCGGASGGFPAPRLNVVVASLGLQGLYNLGVDASGTPLPSDTVNICSSSYRDAFRLLGQRLRDSL